ncbi:MAG: AI-2E family transporter [Deltaproteobacteria bacterium]|nr:AI-2E family transporter [Deltaproteobacteria bacterium]
MGTEQRSQVSPRTIWTIGLNVVAMAFLFYLLYRIRALLVLVAVAIFLAAAINPAVEWLEQRGLRRGLGILAVFVLLFVLVGLVPLSFVPVLNEQGQSFVQELPELLDRVRKAPMIQWVDSRFDLFGQVEGDLKEYAQTVASSALGVVTGIFKGLFAFGTVLVMTVFMLIFGGEIFGKGLKQLRPSDRPRYIDLAARMQKTVGGYVVGTLIVALIGGIVMTVALLALGVPYFLPLGLAMFILGIIPYIGPTLAAVLIVGTTFAAAGLTPGIVMTAVVVLYQVAENNLLQPLVQRRTIQMNPLIIFLAFLIGASLAGVLGALLALPVAGVIQIVIRDSMLEAKT